MKLASTSLSDCVSKFNTVLNTGYSSRTRRFGKTFYVATTNNSSAPSIALNHRKPKKSSSKKDCKTVAMWLAMGIPVEGRDRQIKNCPWWDMKTVYCRNPDGSKTPVINTLLSKTHYVPNWQFRQKLY
jgi:hypothetical protein